MRELQARLEAQQSEASATLQAMKGAASALLQEREHAHHQHVAQVKLAAEERMEAVRAGSAAEANRCRAEAARARAGTGEEIRALDAEYTQVGGGAACV